MSGVEQVQDNRDAEISDQEAKGDVHHFADVAACWGHKSRAEDDDFRAGDGLCSPRSPAWVLSAAPGSWAGADKRSAVISLTLPRAARYRSRDLPFSK